VKGDFLRKMLFLPEQASTASLWIDHLHYFVIITSMVASIVVGGTAIYFFVRYRRRSAFQKTPRIEPTWWMELMIIATPAVFFFWWFARGFSDFVHIETPPPNTLDVYVMGKQWMWKFAYPDGPSSVNTLHVPAYRPVRLLLTSRDVIHSFFVPAFRIKQDALPGRYTQIWFEARKTGTFQVLCAEFCGTQHSTMWGDVVAMEPREFDAWFQEQKKGLAPRIDQAPAPREQGVSQMVKEGQRVAADQGCLKCHTLDGTAHIGPTWKGMYGRLEQLQSGKSVVVDEEYITRSMMDPMADIVAGYQPVMPTYRGRISPAETAAILELIKHLRTDSVANGPSEGPAYDLKPR
jgi:cytochrome c oxidase subunit 2